MEFLAVLPLEAEEWAPFTKLNSNSPSTLIEIDKTKDGMQFPHTLSLLSASLSGIMQTVRSENRQNLMRLFYMSGVCRVCIGERVCN